MTPILPSDVDASAPSRVSEKAVEAATTALAAKLSAMFAPNMATNLGRELGEIALVAALPHLHLRPHEGHSVAWPVEIGIAELKRLREVRKLSLRDLAEEVGIGHATLARIEKGATPDMDTARKLMPYAGMCLCCGRSALSPIPAAPVQSEGEPFGYWCKHKLADGALLRKPSYIPEPSDTMTVIPLYTSPQPVEPAPGAGEDAGREADAWQHRWTMFDGSWSQWYQCSKAEYDSYLGNPTSRIEVRELQALSRTRQPSPKPAQGMGDWRAQERHPNREEAREAATVLMFCNGHDLDAWGAEALLFDDASDALKALAQGESK